jgi:nicotinate-nucleotide--dimethylbenzimidazole phosphoribosyltransferase
LGHDGRVPLTENRPPLLETTHTANVPVSAQAERAAEERQGLLTKPPGSMGALEPLGSRLPGL